VVVAVAVEREGINTLLFASQVVLSVVLPFVAFPLIYLTSKEAVMRVQKPPQEAEVVGQTEKGPEQISAAFEISDSGESQTVKTEIVPNVEEETVDFSNGLMLASLAYVIWCIVLVANAYAIAMLFLN
jgi:metal iron transporter